MEGTLEVRDNIGEQTTNLQNTNRVLKPARVRYPTRRQLELRGPKVWFCRFGHAEFVEVAFTDGGYGVSEVEIDDLRPATGYGHVMAALTYVDRHSSPFL